MRIGIGTGTGTEEGKVRRRGEGNDSLGLAWFLGKEGGRTAQKKKKVTGRRARIETGTGQVKQEKQLASRGVCRKRNRYCCSC